ncbi:hypothetical protein SAMN06297251_1276 [Fulvimarina manganoxydans]|uniref:Uncharacterized protein n=1 Tax=Fulvimarina manganoxydans TaxID=937218 RepID=A0A1W2EJR6_9HYPH|nr:hypothetical protein [Fulvimarina manganoxydans]SMD09914.1 hypothetical protein SAMN06297251_1276 [Fulvimarina manganoxydans]
MESLLAELPEWARSLFYISVAIGGAILFLHGRSRRQETVDGAEPTAPNLRLDAALLDRRQIEIAREELSDHAEALREQAEAIREHTRALHSLEKEIEEHRREISRLR